MLILCEKPGRIVFDNVCVDFLYFYGDFLSIAVQRFEKRSSFTRFFPGERTWNRIP